MSLFSVNNTVTKLSAPAANDIEVSFGLAALKLLEKNDQADDDALAVRAVGEQPGEDDEKQDRQIGGHVHGRDPGVRAGHLLDDPEQSGGLDPVADVREERAGPEKRVVPVPERGQSPPGRARGGGLLGHLRILY